MRSFSMAGIGWLFVGFVVRLFTSTFTIAGRDRFECFEFRLTGGGGL